MRKVWLSGSVCHKSRFINTQYLVHLFKHLFTCKTTSVVWMSVPPAVVSMLLLRQHKSSRCPATSAQVRIFPTVWICRSKSPTVHLLYGFPNSSPSYSFARQDNFLCQDCDTSTCFKIWFGNANCSRLSAPSITSAIILDRLSACRSKCSSSALS